MTTAPGSRNAAFPPRARPIRVLHVTGGLNVGGIENWLCQVLERLDRNVIAADVVVQSEQPGDYDQRVQDTGARLLRCPPPTPTRPVRYARGLLRVMRENGPYDVVHSHPHAWSGVVLRLARRAGVPVRIAHSHNASSFSQASPLPWWRGYHRLMARWIQRDATHGFACSSPAARSLFGPHWRGDPRWRVLPNAINLHPFRKAENPSDKRADLGLPQRALVLGNVGRLVPQKNQRFLIDVLAEVLKTREEARLLLIGDGPDMPLLRNLVQQRKLTNHVVFTGTRGDVPALLLGAVNVFVLPSWWEGFGLVLVEAQAAGLPCVFAEHLPTEAAVLAPLIHRVSLDAPPHTWAKTILAAMHTPPPLSQTEALARLEQSPVNLDHQVAQLQQCYQQDVAAVS